MLAAASVAAEEPASDPGSFSLAEVRAAAPIATYRLERAYYDHLVETARGLAAARGEASGADVRIAGVEAPRRPRLALATEDAPRLGPAEAPVTIVVVEDLSQVHARRLDGELQRLRRRLGSDLALVHVPLVDARHRQAWAVAVAARCAHAEGRFWAYRGQLLAHLDDLGPAALEGHARALGVDRARFRACVEGGAAAVAAADAAARRAGIVLAPTLLVNGLYVGGGEPPAALAAVVDEARAADAAAGVPPSTLPFDVVGIVQLPGRAPEAMIVPRATGGDGRVVTVGDRLTADAVVTRIVPDAVIVRRAGGDERLPLVPRAGAATPGAAPARSDRALVTEHVHTLALDGAFVRRLAAARGEVEAQFSAAPLDVAGKRLLKLTGESQRDLLARLGLEAGDVLMRVDDEWVYEGRNTLVPAIADGLPVTLVVVRRGIPRLIELVAEEGG